MLNLRKVCSVFLLMLIVSMVLVQPASLEDRPSRPKKRSYYTAWRSNALNVHEANKVFEPARNTISRPYYIPVFGTMGRYMYYPPQPFYRNVGSPIDNPIRSTFQGPPYLPPSRPTSKPGLGNRFGMSDYEDEEMGPIWGAPLKNSGSMQLSGGQDTQGSVVPTRPPISIIPTSPPLMHTVQENQFPSQTSAAAQRPESLYQSSTQSKEVPQNPTPSSQSSGPSNCAWAIISCCSVSSPSVFPETCFEQRGCPGPFWGTNPCNSDYAKAAIQAASEYFTQSRLSENAKRF